MRGGGAALAVLRAYAALWPDSLEFAAAVDDLERLIGGDEVVITEADRCPLTGDAPDYDPSPAVWVKTIAGHRMTCRRERGVWRFECATWPGASSYDGDRTTDRAAAALAAFAGAKPRRRAG